MKIAFRSSFLKDLGAITDAKLKKRIAEVIEEVETAERLIDIGGMKALTGQQGFHRIRVGSYRIGVTVSNDTVEFVRCLHRREVYRFFP